MILNSKVYDILKWGLLIVSPAFVTLYLGLDTVWGLPYPEQVSQTVTLISAFLGIILGLSSYTYHKDEEDETIDIDVPTFDAE